MRFARSLVTIALACTLISIVSVSGPAPAGAAANACTRFVGGLQALLCVNQSTRAYGIFATFIYPDVSHESDFDTTRNVTRFYTDPVNGQWIDLGLNVESRPGGGLSYRPYWYAHPFGPATWLPASTVSDKKVHTFMAIPHCDGCKRWDIFYDFNHVGTTPELSSNMALYMSTGLVAGHGTTAVGRTQNRVRFLNGNLNFELFDMSNTSNLVTPRWCSTVRCTRFDVAIHLDGGFVSAWEVGLSSAPAVGFPASQQSPSSSVAEQDLVELERRAQQIVDERLRAG